jgi:hypothetical protein
MSLAIAIPFAFTLLQLEGFFLPPSQLIQVLVEYHQHFPPQRYSLVIILLPMALLHHYIHFLNP